MQGNDAPPDVLAPLGSIPLGKFFDALVDRFAERLADRMSRKETNDNGRDFYTAKTAERECGISPTTFKRNCRDGLFEGAKKPGREWIAPRASVQKWLDSLPTAGRAPAGRDEPAPATERSAEELLEAMRRDEEKAPRAPRGRRKR